MTHLWKNYNLSIVLAVLFLFSWVLQFWTGWQSFAGDQQQHGQQAEMAAYLWRFGEGTFENWQSEFLQLFSFVVLTAFLIHRGSHESKDTDDEVMERLKRLEKKIDELQSVTGERKIPVLQK
jgi:hypothetical protein